MKIEVSKLGKNKITKVVTVFTIIFVILTLVSVFQNFIMPIYPLSKLQKQIGRSNSIGIIGGADGPTAIYVANKSSVYIFIAIFALLSITGVLYLFHIKKVVK